MTRKSVRKCNYGRFHKTKRPTWRNNHKKFIDIT